MLIKLYIVAIATLTLSPSIKAMGNRNWGLKPYLQKDTLFETERISQMQKLIGPSLFDVGTCPVGTCAMKSYLSYFGCPDDAYICTVTETRQADLGAFGIQEYEYVTKCVCCEDLGVPVKIRVVDAQSDASLGQMSIHFNDKLVGTTDEDGNLESLVDSSERSLVVKAHDAENNVYLDALRVFEITFGNRGPIEVTLYMIMKADAIEIDSTSEVVLSLSADPLDSTAGNATMAFEPNSFIRQDGSQYNGQVLASITYINPNNGLSNRVPGNFLTLDPTTGNLESLVSDGIVAMTFADESGDELLLDKPVLFNVREDMEIWILNTASGIWERVENLLSDDRDKRQIILTEELLVNVASGLWINIDAIYRAPSCYFKARIFDEMSGVEITSSSTASFKPDILAYTNMDRLLSFYHASTSTPSNTCFQVRCPDEGDRYDPLIGFIGMLSIESVSVGGTFVPHVTYLVPQIYFDYSPAIQTELSAVQYDITPDGLEVFVGFASNDDGPFYTSPTACENSAVDKPHFHFFKPALPSYADVPDDMNECTARLRFRDNGNFHYYLENSPYLPNITAISIWVEDGQTYYYTFTTQLQQSDNSDGDYFVFACLKYRCSETDEPTTVYLDIDVPVNDTVNMDMEEYYGDNYTASAFVCYGECVGPLCFADEGERLENGVNVIDGSFEAPVNVGSGPDFYDSETTECNALIAPSEEFAYEFNCYANSPNTLA